jgi:hypothetical protein
MGDHDQLKHAAADLFSELELEKAAKDEALTVLASADATIKIAYENEQKAKVHVAYFTR